MLEVLVTLEENFDEEHNVFVASKTFTLKLEHSLASLSKWESKFEKPFLGKESRTPEEALFYIQHCMTLDTDFPEDLFQNLSKKNFDDIQAYIASKQTATWFNDPQNSPPPRQILTAEVIYGWMVAFRIPFETQYWHLNRLLTLVRVCNEQSKKPKKMGRGEAARQQAALNAQRQAQYGTRG